MKLASEQNERRAVCDDALLADRLLGGGLSPAAEQHLLAAGRAYGLDGVAESHLREALRLDPGHAAVLIGFYRFYFYKGRLAEALDIAKLCLAKAASDIGLSPDWRRVRPADAPFARYEEALPRFFLFSLKGNAYLQMRLGNLAEGRAATCKLLELDPSDKIGAKVLLEVLDRMGRDDE